MESSSSESQVTYGNTGNLSFNVGHDIFGSVTNGSLIHVPHKEVKWTLSDQRNSWTNTSTFYDFKSNHLDKLILELVFKGNARLVLMFW